MSKFRNVSLAAVGAATAGAILALTAPLAQTQSPLATAHNLCDVIEGSFTTEVFGRQTNSTCTFSNGAHHFYYDNGEFRSAD